jgi:hypothetical protein
LHAASLSRLAEANLALLNPEQRRAILRIIARIEHDPTPDYQVKAPYSGGRGELLYLYHRGHWAVYIIIGNQVLVKRVGVGSPYTDTGAR